MNQSNKKIIMAGGGTGGPVFPMIAVAKEILKHQPSVEFLFIGTKRGPDKKLVEDAGFKFAAIPAAKFRRYFSIANFTDIFVFIYSLFVARRILKQFQPDLVFSAGGFVAVPISWMARLMNIKIGVHQQDSYVGLANRMISPFASFITTALDRTSKQFFSGSGLGKNSLKPVAEWVGNPVREEFFTPASPDAKKKFGLEENGLPILLIFGGATGAAQINEVVGMCMPELVNTHQVIHITGPGRNITSYKHPFYHQFEFLGSDFPDALKIADTVICRAGLSTIAELSVLGKIAIVVPMPDSHQEENAEILKERAAAVVLNKQEFNPEDLPRIVSSLKFNIGRQKLLMENIKKIMPADAADKIAKIILDHVK
jgi:UDP-N-acetylglucosamine--N-acetylmuramyl-(pentapeptide) pyrophosphoryl-undecaprenol N-acetylglucosamine transferase